MRPGLLLCGSDTDDQPTPLDRLSVTGSASPPSGAGAWGTSADRHNRMPIGGPRSREKEGLAHAETANARCIWTGSVSVR
jgi:hypothetical protein